VHLLNGFIVAAREKESVAQIRVVDERERIQLDRSLSLNDRVIEPAQCGQSDVAVPMVCSRVIWKSFRVSRVR